MNPQELYDWVRCGTDHPAKVAALHDEALCALSGWLSRRYDENAESGELLGLCLVESARRFSVGVASRREGKLL